MLNKFFLRHSFKVILIVIFLLPVMSRGARKALMSNDNDVHDWLPDTYDETLDFEWFQKHFENETFVLISWDGCTLQDERLELLAKKLVPPEGADGAAAAVVIPKQPEPRKWYDDLFFAKWFKKPDADLAAAGPLFKGVQTGPQLMDRLMSAPLNLSEAEATRRLSGLFVGPDGKQSCAVVTLTPEGKHDLRLTLKKLRSVTENELGMSHQQVRMGGPPVDNVAISEEGEKTLFRLFIPAGIVGLSLAFWCLRSVRLTTMVFSAALYAGAISLAMVYYSGASMNAILLTMPAVVYVAGVSGAIHFANYYRDSVAEAGVDARRPERSSIPGFRVRYRRSPRRSDCCRSTPASWCRSACLVSIRRSGCCRRWACCLFSCRRGCSFGRCVRTAFWTAINPRLKISRCQPAGATCCKAWSTTIAWCSWPWWP